MRRRLNIWNISQAVTLFQSFPFTRDLVGGWGERGGALSPNEGYTETRLLAQDVRNRLEPAEPVACGARQSRWPRGIERLCGWVLCFSLWFRSSSLEIPLSAPHFFLGKGMGWPLGFGLRAGFENGFGQADIVLGCDFKIRCASFNDFDRMT